jgi:hypothetical protein
MVQAGAGRQDVRILRGSCCAAVPGPVIAVVGVVVAVGLVVLAVVGDKIVQCEAIVAGDDIHR